MMFDFAATLFRYPTREEFLALYLRQQFSLPDSLIYYIIKNPKSSKIYLKLVGSCKQFFLKNPILVFHCLEICDDGWKICSLRFNCRDKHFLQRTKINFKNLSKCKLWIDFQIRIYSTNSSNFAADLVPHIYQSDATIVNLIGQKISLQQFLHYSQSVHKLSLKLTTLSSDFNCEIPIEEIIASLPNIKAFVIKFAPDSKNVSSDSVRKLLSIPHFQNVSFFGMTDVSQNFDIDALYDYYKENRSRFSFGITYSGSISEAFAEKVDGINNETLDYKFYKTINCKRPSLIYYPEQPANVRSALLKLSKLTR